MEEFGSRKEPKIEYLDRAYIHSLCEICNEDNELLAFARLQKIEGDIYEFSVTSGARLRTAYFDTPVKINVMNLRQGFKVLAGNIRVANKMTFRVFVTDILANVEQRGFVRIRIQERATIYDIPDEKTLNSVLNNTASIWNRETPSKHSQISMMDISISGCQFSSNEEWRLYDQVLLHVLLRDVWISQAATIVRVERRNGVYFYGCRFMAAQRAQTTDDLAKVIFGLQNEQRKRMN